MLLFFLFFRIKFNAVSSSKMKLKISSHLCYIAFYAELSQNALNFIRKSLISSIDEIKDSIAISTINWITLLEQLQLPPPPRAAVIKSSTTILPLLANESQPHQIIVIFAAAADIVGFLASVPKY